MATYYMAMAASGGSNSNNGLTPDKPFLTLAYASSVATNYGDLIKIRAGTYTETTNSVIAEGVSLEGEGWNTRIINGLTGDDTFLLDLVSYTENTTSVQSISKMQLEGNITTRWGAIFIKARSGVDVHHVYFKNFHNTACIFHGLEYTDWLGEDPADPGIWCYNNKFHDNVTWDTCGYHDTPSVYLSGSLQIGSQDGILIYNNVFNENQRATGQCGYPIKLFCSGFNRGVKIYDNFLYKKPAGTDWWDWNFAIELWYWRGGVEIYDNYIEGSIDIDHTTKGTYDYAFDIHDNIFGYTAIQPTTYYNGNSGCYLEYSIVGPGYIRNNTFQHLEAPIRFSPRSGNNMADIYIFNNLFKRIGNTDGSGSCRILDWADQGTGTWDITNFNFVHNTIYAGGTGVDYGLAILDNSGTTRLGSATNINVKNNIFVGFDNYPVYYNRSSGQTVDNLHIDNNIFYGNGTNSILQQDLAATNYTANNNVTTQPKWKCPGVDFGLMVSQNGEYISYVDKDFNGNTRLNPPDIGAFEFIQIIMGTPIQTYTISSARDFRPGTVEMPSGSISGHPYLTDQCAALALFNRTGSQRKVTIIDVFFRDLTAANSVSQTAIDFARITAYTGGEDVISPFMMDSNNAALPSQVVCVEDVDTVTTTNGNFGRPIINLPFWSESQSALNRPGALIPGDSFNGLNSANFFYQNFTRVTDIQGIILREGQGFCIMPRNNAVYQAVKYKAIIHFRVVATGACYMVSDAIVMSGDRVPLVLFNGSSSGVVLEIYQVDLMEIGSTTSPYLMSVERIDGLLIDHSEQSVIVSHDAINESLTGLVDYRREASVQIAGNKTGAFMSKPILIRDWQTALGGAAIANLPNFAARNPTFLIPEDNVSHRILNEGEGIAIFRRTMSGIGKSSIMVTFMIESTIQTGGGGVRNYAFIG